MSQNDWTPKQDASVPKKAKSHQPLSRYVLAPAHFGTKQNQLCFEVIFAVEHLETKVKPNPNCALQQTLDTKKIEQRIVESMCLGVYDVILHVNTCFHDDMSWYFSSPTSIHRQNSNNCHSLDRIPGSPVPRAPPASPASQRQRSGRQHCHAFFGSGNGNPEEFQHEQHMFIHFLH